MASIIKIKRSGTSGAPPTLKLGEMAYSYLAGTEGNGGDRLYMGTSGVDGSGNANLIEVIGGVYFTDKLDHTPGTLTASSAIITDTNNKIDNLKVDNIDINGNTISTTNTNGSLVLDPNGSGVINASTSRITNVTDPSDSSDAATKAYADLKLALTGGTMSGNIAMGSNSITGLAAPSNANDATRKTYVDTQDALKLNLTGGTMSGAIAMGTNKITGMGNPTANQDAATKFYVDSNDALKLNLAGGTMSGDIAMGGNKVTGASDPTSDQDLATKAYVDTVSGANTITITGDTGTDTVNLLDSSLTFDGADGLETTVTDNQVTIGVVSGGFPNSSLTNSTVTISADAGSNDAVALGETLTLTGGTAITSTVGANEVTFALDNTAVSAGTYGSASSIPTFTVDAQGRLTAASETNISTDLSIAGDTGTDTVNLLDSDLTFTGGTGIATTVTDNILTIAGTDAAADGSTKGIAAFNATNFSAASGVISSEDITLSGNTGSAAATLGESFTIQGTSAQGISTDATGTTVTITAADATTSSKGVASFASADFSVSSGAVSIKTGGVSNTQLVNSSITITGDGAATDSVGLGETLTISGGTGLTTAITDNTITVSGDDATTSSKGIASFSSSDFSVTSGAVSIATGGVSNAQLAGSIANSKLANSVISVTDGSTSDDVSLGGTLTFADGTGIDVTQSGGTVTVSGTDASTSAKGIASFSSDNFAVSSGVVTIKNGGVNADELAGTLDLSGKSVTLAAGEISNGELANSAVTINGTSISLGGSGTIDTDDINEGSTNLYYTDARADSDAKNAVSAVDAGGDGSFGYDAGTGVFTYTGPSAAETRAHFSGGTGVTYTSGTGVIAIGQAVGTSDSVTFAGLTVTGNTTIDGNLQVNGTQTTINTQTLSVEDNMIYLNQIESAGSPYIAVDLGFAFNYNDSNSSYAHGGLFRDATDGRFKFYGGYTPEPDSDLDIDVDHASFALRDVQVRTLYADKIIGASAGFDSDFAAKTTDDLTEGSTNLYYTTSRVDSDMGDILVAGEGIDITPGAGIITVAAENATTTNKGVASFATADFNVTGGAVELKDTVVKTVSTDGSAATPSTHGVTISGTSAQGITTSGSGSTVTITAANAAADGSTKGVAAFNSTNFSAASGVISTEDITLYSGDDQNGQGSGIAATAGESFNIYGDFSQGIQTTITSGNLIVTGRNATTTSKGVASFGAYADSATDPLAIRQFTITSGDVALTTVDGGTY